MKKEKYLYIYFLKGLEVEDFFVGILMIEGLFLIVKEFGFIKVIFMEIRIKKIGRYDVLDVILVLVVLNLIFLN